MKRVKTKMIKENECTQIQKGKLSNQIDFKENSLPTCIMKEEIVVIMIITGAEVAVVTVEEELTTMKEETRLV